MNEIAYEHLHYRFNNIDLFWQALTHGSWVNENGGHHKSYQVFEFLGDAVLKLIQATILQEKHPDWSEGQLTQVRSSYENNKNLATWTQKLGIEYLIRHGKSINKKSSAWEQICAQVFEAVVGAIWIDCYYNFTVMIDIYKHWGFQIDEEKAISNPKKELQEFVQSKKYGLPIYTIIKKDGPDHQPTFTVECQIKDLNLFTRGQGKSIRDAEKSGAELMIEKLK